MKKIAKYLLVSLLLSGCVQQPNPDADPKPDANEFKELDRNQVATDLSDIIDREKYYEEHVDNVLDDLSESEIDKYLVTIHFTFKNMDKASDDEMIMFLRNDNVLKGDLAIHKSNTFQAGPGVYRVISLKLPKDESIFGEIELLQPGADVQFEIDYATHTVKEIK